DVDHRDAQLPRTPEDPLDVRDRVPARLAAAAGPVPDGLEERLPLVPEDPAVQVHHQQHGTGPAALARRRLHGVARPVTVAEIAVPYSLGHRSLQVRGSRG